MSDSYLRLIPQDPGRLPDEDPIAFALRLIREWFPDMDVSHRKSADIAFIDPGENFERVGCPHCGADVAEPWAAWMEEAYASAFRQRTVVVPCCGLREDLNDLRYQWPAGFAQFVIEIGPRTERFLAAAEIGQLEESLGCSIRQVMTRV